MGASMAKRETRMRPLTQHQTSALKALRQAGGDCALERSRDIKLENGWYYIRRRSIWRQLEKRELVEITYREKADKQSQWDYEYAKTFYMLRVKLTPEGWKAVMFNNDDKAGEADT